MAITYFEKERIFKLDTPASSYVIGIVDKENFVGHVYYGKKLRDANIAYLLRTGEGPFVPSENNRERVSFYDTFPMEYAGNGLGDYRRSSISVRTAGGHTAVSLFYVSHKIYAGKPGLAGLPATFGDENACETLELLCEDPVLGLKVTLLYTAFSDVDVITRSVRIENNGEMLYLTKALSFSMDMDNRDFTLLTMHGSWARERMLEHRKVKKGFMGVESVRGESSHQEHPFMALAAGNADQSHGEVYGMHFVYSGNFIGQVELGQFDTVRVGMGIHPENFCWKLEKGESFQTPEVVLVYSDTGYDGMTHQFHELYRNHLIRSEYKDKKRPILINNWEATYFDFNTEKLLSIAKKAAELGIEMLVMDDGWFGHRNDDSSSLGDWYVNEEKLNGGLKHLVDEVNKLGLKFGIWFEPEMISPDSKLYEAHPDWAIQIPGKKPVRSRNQLLLDFSRKEVRDCVFDQICAVLDQGKIDYVKWDMNRSMADVYAGNLSYDYVLGVYDFMEHLCSRYPDLLLEGCSGGGGRFDAGMLYYSPQIWCSDNTDAINRTRIQYGTSFFYPVSVMGAHVSAVPNHQTGRVTSFHTRGVTAMAGTFGYELNPALLSDEEKQQIREQIKTYKKYETLINEGTYWRLSDPFMDEIAAWMTVSEEQDHALVSAVRLRAEANQAAVYVRLRGLKPDAVYLEEQSGRQYSGAALMHAGIPLPPFTREYEAYQFSLTELKEAGTLYEKVQKWRDGNVKNRVVISLYGGSGSGKTTLATALQQYFLNDGTGCYLLSGDDYPHRIPKRNDEERMRVYKETGEDGLRGYLGTKKEIDFDRINEVLAAFHEGKDTITLRHMGREDGEISSEETDFSGISVLLLEWTHGGSDDLHGVDLPVFLESSPEETKERRIRRNRDENAASPFICRVVELEQEKLEVQRKNAGIIVGKDGRVYEQ